MGTRENAVDRDFSSIGLEEEEEEALKEGAIISMGTEISSDDMANMMSLCDQVQMISCKKISVVKICCCSHLHFCSWACEH